MEAPDEEAQPGAHAVTVDDHVTAETVTEDHVEPSTSQAVAYSEIYSECEEREMWYKRSIETVQMIAREEVNDAVADVLKGIRTTNATEADYQRKCEDFRKRLIQFYTTKKNTVSVSPLRPGRDKPIWDVFVQPKLSHVIIDKDGSRKKTEHVVHQYKDLFYKDEKLNSRVFVQGEPGMGKTTFLTELALDWCDAVSVHNPDHKPTFSDVDTLKKFQFLFQISLRDATDQREVIEMIKTQIIHMIYTDAKREETVKLLPQIMERESCIVTLDGLNEWVDRLNKCVIPFLAQCHLKCVSVITSRPWKMADERIKDSEINSLIEIEGIIDSEKLAKKMIRSLQTGYVKTHTEFMTYVNERQLSHFLTSPWRLTLLVNFWMNYKVSGSLCELNCILIDILFQNANAEKGFFEKGSSFQCLYNTRFVQQQIDIFDALAKAAFHLKFSSNKSFVFAERELLNYMSVVQLEFCLNAGVLTKRYMSYEADEDVQFSFVHETVQDFLAAYHIAKSNQDCIAHFQKQSKYNVLEMSEIIIFLCGLECKKANQLLNRLADVKFLNDINRGLSMYVKRHFDSEDELAFQTDNNTERYVLKSNNNEMEHGARCFALAVLFQRMIIAGYKEAKASGEKDICLNCTDFTFGTHLNKCDSNALKTLLLSNKSHVRSLILESNVLKTSEILTVIQQSKQSLKRLKMRVTEEINKALYHTSIQELNFIGTINVSSFSGIFPTLSQLTFLGIEGSTFSEDIGFPDTLQQIHLMNCTCTAVFLRRIGNLDLGSAECASLASEILHTLNKLTRLYLQGTYTGRCNLKMPDLLNNPCEEPHIHLSDSRSEIVSRDLSNIGISVKNGSKELIEILRDTIRANDSQSSWRHTAKVCVIAAVDQQCVSKLEEALSTNDIVALSLCWTPVSSNDRRRPERQTTRKSRHCR
ncbi:uncharacterized protein LOC127839995 [Dreissena polymorpha]|uniref:uncharacterized protein LOC127839995 n=1 Tax=Dreissena polymorpha TaxID=45954 RepID=UPI0022648C39|nr:uncharacterized protein LOC127839995 [Dreissena polymorpha]